MDFIEAVLGKKPFFFGDSEGSTGCQRNKAEFEVAFFQAVAGDRGFFPRTQFFDALLLVEEVNHFAA